MILLLILIAVQCFGCFAEYDANFITKVLKDTIPPIEYADFIEASHFASSFAKSTLSYVEVPSAGSITAYSVANHAVNEVLSLKTPIAILTENDRKLDVTFTCQSFSGFSPFSQCSDIVDYSFVVPTGSSGAALEVAVRAALTFTESPFIDNVCLTDYKRMRCAQVYMPCVTTGNPTKLPCRSVCEAASTIGTSCAGALEALGMSLDCENVSFFDPDPTTCNPITASVFGPVTVAPHKEFYIGEVCSGYVTETYLGATASIAEIPGLAPLLPPWVQQTLMEMTIAPLFDSIPRYFTETCLTDMRRMFCSLKYMPAQAVTSLSAYFGVVYQPQFPSQQLCLDYEASCAGCLAMIPLLNMNCDLQVAPYMPLFPPEGFGMVNAYFPPAAAPIFVITSTNDAIPDKSKRISTQCPFGYSLETFEGTPENYYSYMLTASATSECKEMCPKPCLGTKHDVRAETKALVAKFCLNIFLSAFPLFNMHQQEPEKRNFAIFGWIWFVMIYYCLGALYIALSTADNPNCLNSVVHRHGGYNKGLADVLVIPIGLIQSSYFYIVILCNLLVSLDLWLRVYWKYKNVDKLKTYYIPVLAFIVLGMFIWSMADSKVIAENSGDNFWNQEYFLSSLPAIKTSADTQFLSVRFNQWFVFLFWLATTSMAAHVIAYCINISLTAIAKTNEENALVKLWKTYRTLILLNLYFQILAILGMMHQVFNNYVFDDEKSTLDYVAKIVAWYGCTIGGFVNLEKTPYAEVDKCFVPLEFGVNVRVNAYDYIKMFCIAIVFYATYTDAIGKAYWKLLPIAVQNFLSKHVYQPSKVHALGEKNGLEDSALKSLEMTSKPLPTKDEESKEVA